MSYKIKSLLYLLCFIATATLYYVTSDTPNIQQEQPMELADAATEQIDLTHHQDLK